MNNRMWGVGAAAVLGLAAVLLIAATVSAQSAAAPGPGVCPGVAQMSAGFGRGPMAAGYGGGVMHAAIAGALGITSQELWQARADGTSIATLARERNVELTTVIDAALAAHLAQLEAAVDAGTLTQAQADAMTAYMKRRVETAFEYPRGIGMPGGGMMGGRGMMGPPSDHPDGRAQASLMTTSHSARSASAPVTSASAISLPRSSADVGCGSPVGRALPIVTSTVRSRWQPRVYALPRLPHRISGSIAPSEESE